MDKREIARDTTSAISTYGGVLVATILYAFGQFEGAVFVLLVSILFEMRWNRILR